MKPTTTFGVLLPTAVLLAAAVAAAQTYTRDRWEMLFPASSPPQLLQHALASDSARRRIVLFGGVESGAAICDDTWEWDGTDWLRRTPATRPPRRALHAMVYDSRRGVTVLFGGWTGTAGSERGDVWEWDGNDWTERTPSIRPPARIAHAMAYDSRRGVTVLFGGTTDPSFRNVFNDTWEWDGTRWRQPTLGWPSGLLVPQMAYHAASGRTLLVSLSTGSFSWTWDGVAWTQHRNNITVGSWRAGPSMAYDPVRAVVVHIVGFRTFEWDGTSWFSPWPYAWHPVDPPAWDATRRRVVGHAGGTTSEYHPLAGDYSTFGVACRGTRGLPTLAPALPPRLGRPFGLRLGNLPVQQPGVILLGLDRSLFGGVPLPWDLTPLGLPGCSLYTSPRIAAAAVSDAQGVVDWGFPLPPLVTWPPSFRDPLLGLHFYNQAFWHDPGANPSGLVATQAGEGIIGR